MSEVVIDRDHPRISGSPYGDIPLASLTDGLASPAVAEHFSRYEGALEQLGPVAAEAEGRIAAARQAVRLQHEARGGCQRALSELFSGDR